MFPRVKPGTNGPGMATAAPPGEDPNAELKKKINDAFQVTAASQRDGSINGCAVSRKGLLSLTEPKVGWLVALRQLCPRAASCHAAAHSCWVIVICALLTSLDSSPSVRARWWFRQCACLHSQRRRAGVQPRGAQCV